MEGFLLVFDINDTLISKIKKTDKYVLDSLTDNQKNNTYSCNNHILLKRPLTDLLVKFLEIHNINYVFWSTSMKHNIKKMIPYLEEIGYNFHLGYFGQEECEEGIITEKIKQKII
ncbi:FCP1 domain-containing protein [Vairimorpha necatrix]|uniref:FCP1 domain-containing protein n=1 Tax=Vairimorpha necatrix TaxID=6039 RepID=A0AAX4JE30_9MICR